MSSWIARFITGMSAVGCSAGVRERSEATAVSPDPESLVELQEAAKTASVRRGAELFARVWVPNDPRTPEGDGLGPVSNAESCATCHHLGGLGGAGGLEANVWMERGVMLSRREMLVPDLSTQIVRPIAKRAPPALFGAGAIDAITDSVLLDAESSGVGGFPEITGRAGRGADGQVARFGWKGNVATLAAFVEQACANELGLETPGAHQPGSKSPGLDLDASSVDALINYVRALPSPILLDTPGAQQGRALFTEIGCGSCHRESLGDVEGIYSDLLIHDLGSELGDESIYYGLLPVVKSPVAAAEWRTPPLWGLRDSAPYLHDGRASTIALAIASHGGEAYKVIRAWGRLSVEDKELVVRFLQSLAAPVSERT